MDEKDLLNKINEESENHVPDVYGKIISTARAEGLLNNDNNTEVYSDGETVALGGVNRKAIAVTTLAALAAVSLAIALPIALSGKPDGNGGLTVPPVNNIAEIPFSDDYAVGAVSTAKLIDAFTQEDGGIKPMAFRTRTKDEKGEFLKYYSAMDSFFGDEKVKTTASNEKSDYKTTISISGMKANGDTVSFSFAYTEAKIVEESAVEGNLVRYNLEGVLRTNGNSFTMIGERAFDGDKEDGQEVSLNIKAYPAYDTDKTTYAQMQLIYEDGVVKYDYKVFVGDKDVPSSGATVTMSGNDDNVVYSLELNDGSDILGVFNVFKLGEDGSLSANYDLGTGDDKDIGTLNITVTDNGYEYFIVNNFEVREQEDGTYAVTGYKAGVTLPKNLIIPSELDGKKVTAIGSSAFKNRLELESLTILWGVTEIGYSAFAGCSNLVEVNLPNSLETLSSYCFESCSKLESIDLPANVKKIYGAFKDCYMLKNVVLPDSLETLGSKTFLGCAIEKLNIPAKIAEMDGTIIGKCNSLQELTVDENNSVFYSENNCVIVKATKTVAAGCKASEIPADGSVTSIGARAFYGCSYKQSLTVPGTVKEIGSAAFCESYISKIILEEGVVTIGEDAFRQSLLQEISLPESLKTISMLAFYRCTSLEGIAIPSGVTTIVGNAFDSCSFMSSITVDENNKNYYSDGNCLIEKSTKTIITGCNYSVIPDDGSIKVIGVCAFRDCVYLQLTSIPYGVTEIEDEAFYGSGISGNLIIPDSVEKIGKSAFEDCKNLTGVKVSANVKELDAACFRDCSNLTTVELPERLEFIQNQAFENCVNLEAINIPDTVWLINGGFEGCIKLKTFEFSASSEYIGSQTLKNCVGIEEITIKSKIDDIGTQAFYGCTNLKKINFTVGTMEEWKAIVEKSREGWNYDTGDYVVVCSDGTLAKDGTVIN